MQCEKETNHVFWGDRCAATVEQLTSGILVFHLTFFHLFNDTHDVIWKPSSSTSLSWSVCVCTARLLLLVVCVTLVY